jgi:acyl-homoserine-lactone acylase
MKKLFLALSFLCFSSLYACKDIPADWDEGGGYTMYWDAYGVPHIHASSAEQLYYALGTAQMEMHGNRMLRLYAESRGEAAAYLGETYLQQDQFVHLMGVPERSKQIWEEQSEQSKAWLMAFTQGINDYAEQHPEFIHEDFRRLLPVSPLDVFNHSQRVIQLTFIGGSALPSARRWEGTLGSNAWAIGPSKSASGNPMLIMNPHLPWDGFFTWMESHWMLGDLNAHGVSLIGTPMLGIAFTDHLGWTHTNNTFDGSDLYEIELQDGTYLLDAESREFTKWEKTLQLKQANGAFKDTTLTFLASEHGPIISQKGNKALALRLSGLDATQTIEQYWNMLHAKNLDEFQLAIADLEIPFFNITYADNSGNIMYFFGGRTPRRPFGDWNTWQLPVNGSKSENIWNDYLRYEELPKVINPSTGFVQNANDPPFTSTIPQQIFADDYPPYVAPRGPVDLRPQRSIQMQLEKEKFTYEDAVASKMSTYMLAAERLVPALLSATADAEDALIAQAAEVLANWDYHADAESKGAVLFYHWYQKGGVRYFAEPWSESEPHVTPRGGLANPDFALEQLEKASKEVMEKYGRLDVAYGEVFKLKAGNKVIPANGAPGEFGVFRTMWFSPKQDGTFENVNGDGWVAVIEFGKQVRAGTLLSYGNSSEQNSPYYGDQLDLFAKKELKPVLRSLKEVRANAMRVDRNAYKN